MPICVIDIETTGLSRYNDTIHTIGFYRETENGLKYTILSLPDDDKKMLKIFKLLKKLKYRLVFHNGKFDTLFINHHYGILLPIHDDTMLMDTAYKMAEKHGLKEAAKRYLGVDDWDITTKNKKSGASADLKEYLKKDLLYTYKLYRYLKERLDTRMIKVYDMLKKANNAYRDIELKGIFFDSKKYMEVKSRYSKEAEKHLKELKSKYDINWNSADQVQKVLYEGEKLPVLARSKKTGKPSADANTIKKLLFQVDNKILNKLTEYKFCYGANSKFLNKWGDFASHDGRIHPSFNLASAVTGRTSCSDPNLQQVPRNTDLRQLFTAPDGYTFVEVDYSQIELRIAAHYANETTMLDIYNCNGDIHTETAIAMTGNLEPSKEERSRAKAINFGFLYGMSARGFIEYAFNSYGLKFSLSEAEKYRHQFFNKYYSLERWYKEMEYMCIEEGGVFNLFGRFRQIDEIYSNNPYTYGCGYRKAINTPVQGTASDILITSMTDISNTFKSKKIPAFVVGTVHDSILFEIKSSVADDIIESIIIPKMVEPVAFNDFNISLNVPLLVDVSKGAWGKGK